MKITAAVVLVRSAPFEIETLDLAAPLTDEVLVRVVTMRLRIGTCCMDAQEPRAVRSRLATGAKWIRIFSSALDRRRFCGFVRVGTDLPAHRSSEQLPASAYRSSCRAAVRGAATHRHDQAASHHGSAVGGASASRNRRFVSAFLQRRVCCELDFGEDPVREMRCPYHAMIATLWWARERGR